MLVGEEVVESGVEEAGVEMELLLIFGAECGVGVDDADEPGVVLQGKGVQESSDVAVFEADDGDADGLRLRGGGGTAEGEHRGDEERGWSEPGGHEGNVTACADWSVPVVAPVLCRMVP